MPADIVEVSIKGLMPTANGCAVFLGNDDKTFVIYVDPSVGSAISMTINGVKKERPLTHDLIGHLLLSGSSSTTSTTALTSPVSSCTCRMNSAASSSSSTPARATPSSSPSSRNA